MIYTRRLFAISMAATGSWWQLYRAPEGQVTIVRDVLLVSEGGDTTGHVFLQVRPLTRTGDWVLAAAADVPAGAMVHLEMRQEILPDEFIWGYVAEGTVSVAATGYILTA